MSRLALWSVIVALAAFPVEASSVQVTERVEAFARAMAVAVDVDPDGRFSHGVDYQPDPGHRGNDGELSSDFGHTIAVLILSPNWHRFIWRAKQWIYVNSGGVLPEVGP